ncbi:MAG TPA: hypothetical protein VIF83_07675 [Gemmatimonadaceae bacterium]
MPSRMLFATLCLAAVAATACASSGSARPRSSPDLITSEEINATAAASAYDLVVRLRPNWLRQGSPGSIGGGVISRQVVVVYLDGNRLGGTETLRSLSAAGIRSMQWLSATRAAVVLRDPGSEALAGAIVVNTRQ